MNRVNRALACPSWLIRRVPFTIRFTPSSYYGPFQCWMVCLLGHPRCCCAAHRQISSCPECTAISNCKFPLEISKKHQKPGGFQPNRKMGSNLPAYLPVCPMEWTNMKCFRDQTLVPSCSHPGLYMMNVHHKSKWSMEPITMCHGCHGTYWSLAEATRSRVAHRRRIEWNVFWPLGPTENTNHWLRDRHEILLNAFIQHMLLILLYICT